MITGWKKPQVISSDGVWPKQSDLPVDTTLPGELVRQLAPAPRHRDSGLQAAEANEPGKQPGGHHERAGEPHGDEPQPPGVSLLGAVRTNPRL